MKEKDLVFCPFPLLFILFLMSNVQNSIGALAAAMDQCTLRMIDIVEAIILALIQSLASWCLCNACYFYTATTIFGGQFLRKQ